MVVDAVICHWVTLMEREEVGPDGFCWAVQWLATLFYANNGLLASPRPNWLQEALDIFSFFFDRVGLQTNAKK